MGKMSGSLQTSLGWRVTSNPQHFKSINLSSQVALVVKNPPANAGDIKDAGLIPGSGRSPVGRHGNPLYYSCLENPMDRGAWKFTFHRSQKSDLTERPSTST